MKKINSWLKNNWKQVFLVVIVILAVGYVTNLKEEAGRSNEEYKQELVEDKVFEYKGKEGVDALTLLKEEREVGLDDVGMVVSIDGIKADSDKREFWGFYVNNQMAQMGAADYQSKDTDVIEWRIENY